MAISSKRNSVIRFVNPNQYFEIDEHFIYQPLDTIQIEPELKVEMEFVTKIAPTQDLMLSCDACSLRRYCSRIDNMWNGMYFVPECEPRNREDGRNVIFLDAKLCQ